MIFFWRGGGVATMSNLRVAKHNNPVRCVPTLWRLKKFLPLVDLGHRLAVAQFAASTRKSKSFFKVESDAMQI